MKMSLFPDADGGVGFHELLYAVQRRAYALGIFNKTHPQAFDIIKKEESRTLEKIVKKTQAYEV